MYPALCCEFDVKKEIYFIERDENTRSDLESLFQLWLRRVGIQEMELGDREEAQFSYNQSNRWSKL